MPLYGRYYNDGRFDNMRHVVWDGGKYEGITQIFTSRTTRDHTYPHLTHHHLFQPFLL
jgi:hypothetical protein